MNDTVIGTLHFVLVGHQHFRIQNRSDRFIPSNQLACIVVANQLHADNQLSRFKVDPQTVSVAIDLATFVRQRTSQRIQDMDRSASAGLLQRNKVFGVVLLAIIKDLWGWRNTEVRRDLLF